jgi:hypothetical protein
LDKEESIMKYYVVWRREHQLVGVGRVVRPFDSEKDAMEFQLSSGLRAKTEILEVEDDV